MTYFFSKLIRKGNPNVCSLDQIIFSPLCVSVRQGSILFSSLNRWHSIPKGTIVFTPCSFYELAIILSLECLTLAAARGRKDGTALKVRIAVANNMCVCNNRSYSHDITERNFHRWKKLGELASTIESALACFRRCVFFFFLNFPPELKGRLGEVTAINKDTIERKWCSLR